MELGEGAPQAVQRHVPAGVRQDLRLAEIEEHIRSKQRGSANGATPINMSFYQPSYLSRPQAVGDETASARVSA
jgi:hypothetical protein